MQDSQVIFGWFWRLLKICGRSISDLRVISVPIPDLPWTFMVLQGNSSVWKGYLSKTSMIVTKNLIPDSKKSFVGCQRNLLVTCWSLVCHSWMSVGQMSIFMRSAPITFASSQELSDRFCITRRSLVKLHWLCSNLSIMKFVGSFGVTCRKIS